MPLSHDALAPSPNILLLHGDQHRADCMGAYGNAEIRTPHLDSLATEGVRFDQCFCPFPVCTPSRYSLLSGRYVHQHRGWTNHCTLSPEIETFVTALKENGYDTCAVGKMHFTPTYLDVGFQNMILSEQDGPGRWDDDYHRELRRWGLVDINDLEDQEKEFRGRARPEYWESFGALSSNLPDEAHSTQWIGDRAVERLEKWGQGGHMMMVGFIKPHHPFDPPRRLANAYEPETLTPLPGYTDQCLERDLAAGRGYFQNELLSLGALKRVMSYYYACIQHIDDQVGRMISVLKTRGLYENTLIVYTSDHGDYMGYHHMLLKGNHMYDPLARIPMIVKYPDHRMGGTVSDALVSTVDVAPTILAEAGLKPCEGMDGMDLGRKHPDRPDRKVMFSEASAGQRVMARTARSKLLLMNGPRGIEGLFFDLDKDPCELNDRWKDPACQEEIRDLTRQITEWRPFEGLSETFLDERALIIDAPNVPSREDGHRQDMMEYFRNKMTEE